VELEVAAAAAESLVAGEAVAPVLEEKQIRLRERVVALAVPVMGQVPAMERVRD
jgi:hypothetical protein